MEYEIDTKQLENEKMKNKGAVPKSSSPRSHKGSPKMPENPKQSKSTNGSSQHASLSKIEEINKIANTPLRIEMPVLEQDDDSTTALLKADSLLRATQQQLLHVQHAFEQTSSSPRINTNMSSLESHSRDNDPQQDRGIITATLKGVVADYKAHFLTGPLDSGKDRKYPVQNKKHTNGTVIPDTLHSNEGNPVASTYDGHHCYNPLQEEMLKTKHSIQEALNTAKGITTILYDRHKPDTQASNLNKSFHQLNNGTYVYQEDDLKRNMEEQDIQERGTIPYKLMSPDYGYNPMPVLKEQTTENETKLFVAYDQINSKPNMVQTACFGTNCFHTHSLGTRIQVRNATPESKHCECKNCHGNTALQASIYQKKMQFQQQGTYRNPDGNSSVKNHNACSSEANKTISDFQGTKTNYGGCTCQRNKQVLNLEGNSAKTNCICVKTCTCKEEKIDKEEKSILNVQGKSSSTNYIRICECEKEKSISDMQRKKLKCSCQNKCTCGEKIRYTKCSNSAVVHLKTCVGGKETPKMRKLCSEGKLIIQTLPSLSIKRNLSVQKIPTVRIPPPGAPPYVSATKNVALWGVSHSQIELDLWDCSPNSHRRKPNAEDERKHSKNCERKSSPSFEEPVVYKKKKTSDPCNLVFQTMPAVELGVGICGECKGSLSEKEIKVGHCLSCNKNSHFMLDESDAFQRSTQTHQSSSEQHAQCKKCKKTFFLKDLYYGVCKYCCNMSIRNEISKICMSAVSPDIIKTAAHLGQCKECHRYFPLSELFQGHCIACQITKKEVRLYQCDSCLNSIPSTEYFEGKCSRCYQMLLHGTGNDGTVPTEIAMMQQSLQSVFDGTPFLFDLNVAQGINRTICSSRSTCEIRRRDATFTVYPVAQNGENSRSRSLVQGEETKIDNANKESIILGSKVKDKKNSKYKERNKNQSEKKSNIYVNKTEPYSTWFKKKKSVPKGTSDNSFDMNRDTDSLNNGFCNKSSKTHSGSSNETSENSKTKQPKVRYILDIDKDLSLEDRDVLNTATDTNGSNLAVQSEDSASEFTGMKQNLDLQSVTYEKSDKRNDDDDDSCDTEYERYVFEKRNAFKRRATPYFGRKEAERLSEIFSNIIQKSKNSADLDEDKNSTTSSIQSRSEEHPNKLSETEAQHLSLAIEEVLENEEVYNRNNVLKSIPKPQETSVINKNILVKNICEEKTKASCESSNNSEIKSDEFNKVIEKSPRKEQVAQAVDRKSAGSQTMSLFMVDGVERKLPTKSKIQKPISDALSDEKTSKYDSTLLKNKPDAPSMEEGDKYYISSSKSDSEDEDIKELTESNKKGENEIMKDNVEAGLGSSLTSGTDAKIEGESVADDKTTITEGDDIYEDDWEEESDKGDSDNRSVEKEDIGLDVGVNKGGVKNSKENHEDSTILSSFPKPESDKNGKEICLEKTLYVKNVSTSSKNPSKLHTDYIMQTVQTEKFNQKTARTQTYQEKMPCVSDMPMDPCDKVSKKNHTQMVKNVKKCPERSANLKKFPSNKSYTTKHSEEYPTNQHVKQKKDDHYETCKKQSFNEFLTSRIKIIPKCPFISNMSGNYPQGQVSKVKAMNDNFPCPKNVKKCPFDIASDVKRNVKCPTYQLAKYGKCSTDIPLDADKDTVVALPPPVGTVEISTSSICINLIDIGTSVTDLMAENLEEKEMSANKVSHLDVSTSPLSLPAMIDEQLSSANFPAANLIDNATSPIPSIECVSKLTSPIKVFIPEDTDRVASLISISKNFTDSETFPIQTEECVCKSTSPTSISLPEKLDKDTSVTGISRNVMDKETSIQPEECVCKSTSPMSISLPDKFDKDTSVTSLARNVRDKGTSPIHSVEVVCKGTSAMSISLPEKIDRDTSVTCIPGSLVDKESSPIPSIERISEATIPESLSPQDKVDILPVCTSSECAACKKLIPDDTVKSGLQMNFLSKSKSNKKYLSNELVASRRGECHKSHDMKSESGGEPVRSTVFEKKKTAQFKRLSSKIKQHVQDDDTPSSDDEHCEVKSAHHRQMAYSEGELLLSCSVCSLEATEDLSVSLTKSTVTNPFSTGEVFSCQCFEGFCACSEGEIAREHTQYKYNNQEFSASQTNDIEQVLISSAVGDDWESSEESNGHEREFKHDRIYKDRAAHCCKHVNHQSEGELSDNSEDLSDGQILGIS